MAQQKTADSDLFDLLDTHHPQYDKWAPEWEIYRDMSGDDEMVKEDYLPMNELEPQNQYRYRIDISELIPETPLAIGRLAAALYKQKPTRTVPKEVQPFIDDADLQGKSFDSFMQDVILSLMTYGTLRILVNVKLPESRYGESGEVLPITRAEEIDQGVRPYVILYSPLSVIDWAVDQFGNLLMVRIKETTWEKESPSDPFSPNVSITKFLHFDRQKVEWWRFSTNEKLQLGHGQHDHGLGVVPMVVYQWPKKLAPMIGSSFIRFMAKADLQRFRAESDQAYDVWLHAHPILKIWTKEELARVGIGSSAFLKLHPGDPGQQRDDADYCQPPPTAFSALRDMIADKLDAIHRHASSDPASVMQDQGPYGVSGVSRAWSFGTSEERILHELADAAVDIENGILELVMRYQEEVEELDEKLFDGNIQYPEEFDIASTSQLIQETGQISTMVNSPTLIRLLQKRIAASKIGDATAEDLSTVESEIDNNPLIGTMAGKTRSPMEMPTIPPPPKPEEAEDETETEDEED